MKDLPLQSTSNALAGSPSNVMEPVAQILEKSWQARRTIRVVIYRQAGKREKDDLLVALVEGLIRELAAAHAVQLRVPSWPLLWFLPLFLFKGARPPPILEIAGTVYSQGIVPPKEELKNHIRLLLT